MQTQFSFFAFKFFLKKIPYKFSVVLFMIVSFHYSINAQNFKRVKIDNNDIIYVSSEDRIYTTTKEGGSNGNSLCIINPYLGIIEESYFIGNKPNKMAISDDESYIYIATENDEEVVRFNLSTKVLDLTFEVGLDSSSSFLPPLRVEDIKVIPGQPNSVVISTIDVSSYHQFVAVYDFGVRRPLVSEYSRSNFLSFIEGNGKFFGYNNQNSSYGITELFIDSSGVTTGIHTEDIMSGITNMIESKGNFLYDEKGKMVDVLNENPFLAGTFMLTGNTSGFLCKAALEPAPDQDVVYYVYYPSGSGDIYLEIFDQTTFESISYEEIPNALGTNGGTIKDLINWGPDQKLAFNTDTYIGIIRNCTPLVTDTLVINSMGGGCYGETDTLIAPGDYDNYYWSNGIQGDSFITSTPGYYTVAVIDSLGCVGPASNTIQLQFSGSLSAPSIQGDPILCTGEIGEFYGSGTTAIETYIWSTGDSTKHIETGEAGTLWVLGENEWGCQSEKTEIEVVVLPDTFPDPPMIINIGDSEICNGDSTILIGPSGFSNYLWSTGETTSEIDVTSAGNYYLKVGTHEECLSFYSQPEQVLVAFINPPFIQLDGQVLVSSYPSGNQWFLNGQPIPGGVSVGSLFYPVEEGFYSVQVTQDSCTSDFSNIIEYMIVDIQNVVKNNKISIYPTPSGASVQILIKDENVKKSSIEIYNFSGRLVWKHNNISFGNNYELNVSNLPSGTYQVMIFDENRKIFDVEKLIKL